MKHTDLPINCAAIRLFINNEGVVEGEVAWRCADNLDQENVDALVESVHGLLALATSQFDQVRAAGRMFQAGQSAGSDEYMTFTPDPQEDEAVSDKVVSFNPSKRKQ